MKRNRETGFVLLNVLIYSLLGAIVITGTYRLLDQRIDALKIIRMQERMRLLEQRIINSAKSRAALALTGAKNPGSTLTKCLQEQDCRARGVFEAIKLFDVIGQPLSTKLDLSGMPCKGSCPIEVKTETQLICSNGQTACQQPGEIQTRYSIQKSDNEQLKGRKFPPIEGVASLSTFVCPKDEYVRSISAEGLIGCSTVEASVNAISCPAGTAAVGLDSSGFLKCAVIKDLCAVDIGLATVLDISSSMRGSKINIARQVLGDFVLRMKSSDQGTYSIFDEGSQLIKPISNKFMDMATVIKGQKTTEGTNMAAGLKTGAQSIASFNSGEKLMIFLSDGRNNGDADPVRTAAQIKAQGVRIISVGFGNNADVRTLRSIASSPQDYFDSTNINDLSTVFSRIGKVACR